MILAVDPSVRALGGALFDERDWGRWELVHAFEVTPAVIKHEDPVERWHRVAREFHGCIDPRIGLDMLVCERPQIYQRVTGKSKGDPNQMLGMVGVLGALKVLLDTPVTSYLPAEWKGQTPKKTMCRRILSYLSTREKKLVPRSDDAIDAVGVGLKYVGRLGGKHVFPGAT